MTEQAKPCPFCGGAAAHGIWSGGYMAVRCLRCDASGPSTKKPVPEICIDIHPWISECIAAWNARSEALVGGGGKRSSSAERESSLRCAPDEPHSAGWRGIASAPRDGSEQIVSPGFSGAQWSVAQWAKDRVRGEPREGWWCEGLWLAPQPSHWMPLPAPPPQNTLSGAQGREDAG